MERFFRSAVSHVIGVLCWRSMRVWLIARFCFISRILAEQTRWSVEEQGYDSEESRLLAFHKGLIQHESITGNEKGAGAYLEHYLKQLGWHTIVLPTFGDSSRPNVMAWPGKSNRTELLVTSHIDTVPPYIPYSRDGNVIRGRGSADAKASVVTQISALQRLIKAKRIDPDKVAVLYVSGEEVTGDGMRSFSAQMLTEKRSWPNILFGEPTEGTLATGHKGIVILNLTASGVASHSGYPELGSSATAKLVSVLHTLLRHTWPEDPVLGNTTFNIGAIEGGLAANIVAAHASAHLSLRISSNVTAVLDYLRATISKEANVSYEIEQATQPTRLDIIEGLFPLQAFSYSTDIPNLSLEVANGKRYLFGPGSILVAHSDREQISVEELRNAIFDYEKLFTSILGYV